MRKLLSVGALLAASTLTFWQPKPAMAEPARVVVVVRRHPHHYRYYRDYYRHGHYYRYYYR